MRARALLRPGPFGLGLFAGLALFLLGFLAYLYWPRPQTGHGPPGELELTSSGADVTRHGGRKVIISSERGTVTQACNDACDDIRHSSTSQGETFSVQVRDAAGRPVAPDQGAFAPGAGQRTEVTISGADRLTTTVTTPGASTTP